MREGALSRVRRWFGPPLAPDVRAAYEAERSATNGRRLVVLLPLLVVGHAVHVAAFGVVGAERAALDPQILRWRDGIALTHAVTLVVSAALVASYAFSRRRERAARWIGPVGALIYVLHGAIIAGIDQLSVTSVTPFVGYALGVAVVIALSPRVATAIFATAGATFVAMILAMQPLPSARRAILPNGASTTVLAIAIASILDRARRREFVHERTIDEQRRALEDLNAGLERRVSDQVSELVAHAAAVERLNAQLQAQVRARSTELSLALAKLAHERDDGGTLRKGFVLGDRFEIGEAIGEGGMGAVYAGVDRTTSERVAIKVIQASSSQELDALHRFLREASAAAAIAHPAVVKMLHVDVSDDGMLFQVQELVEGTTLHARMRNGEAWPAGPVARLGAVLADALAAAHARGVVHRDVKPPNVMLTKTAPGMKLLDFGISKIFDDAQRTAGTTRAGILLGTPAYMAPEQIGGGAVTDRADVYAVGVTLFVLLTGRHPFGAETPRAMIYSHLAMAAPDVRSIAPTVPSALSTLVARCLAKAPVDRPSANDLSRALAAVADAEDAPSLEVLEERGLLGESSSAPLRKSELAETVRERPRKPSA
jgi:serine/threonine-protein kinase